MKFKLIEKFDETRSVVQEYMYDAIDELNNASLEEYIQWFKSELTCYGEDIEQAVTDAYIEACDYGMIKGVEKTRLTSELKEYIESHTDIIDDTDELMKQCPGHLQHELKIVLSILDESLTEQLLTEGNSTYLRDFIFSLAKFAGIDLASEFNVSNNDNLVIHHTDNDKKTNTPDKLILMLSSKHKSMHNTYSGTKYHEDAYKDQKYAPVMPVSTLLNRVALELMAISE